ncbi:MAG: nitroreductase family protein [Chloroflexi bacterium]|nr:nitroreductase family protein [Chloroflexota bacterium]
MLDNLIRTRRSIRRYADRPVPRALIEAAIEAATWAPSPHNSQPWRFVVVTDRERKAELAEAMGRDYRRDMEADGVPPSVVEARLAESRERFRGSPVLIVVCLCPEGLDEYPDVERRQAEAVMGVQGVAAAIQNLLLAMHSYGLGACWLCAPLFCPATVKTVLGISQDWSPQALIRAGYPAHDPKPPKRRPIESLVLWR